MRELSNGLSSSYKIESMTTTKGGGFELFFLLLLPLYILTYLFLSRPFFAVWTFLLGLFYINPAPKSVRRRIDPDRLQRNQQQLQQRRLKRLKRQAAQLGLELVSQEMVAGW